jgi:hypothetical protein
VLIRHGSLSFHCCPELRLVNWNAFFLSCVLVVSFSA